MCIALQTLMYNTRQACILQTLNKGQREKNQPKQVFILRGSAKNLVIERLVALETFCNSKQCSSLMWSVSLSALQMHFWEWSSEFFSAYNRWPWLRRRQSNDFFGGHLFFPDFRHFLQVFMLKRQNHFVPRKSRVQVHSGFSLL